MKHEETTGAVAPPVEEGLGGNATLLAHGLPAVAPLSGLRELLRNEPNPIENLVSAQQQVVIRSGWFAELEKGTAHFLKTGKRIVALECGHYVLSKSLHRAACVRCGEMIRSGYDYDGFRRLRMPDKFNWADDPLIQINERG